MFKNKFKTSNKKQDAITRVALINFTRRPFPVDPGFFGQNFIPLGFATASKLLEGYNVRNLAFVRSKPESDEIASKMQRISKQRFNTDLNFGYGHGNINVLVKLAQKQINEGYMPVFDFHYPVQDSRLMKDLDNVLLSLGIRERVKIVNHLHITPEYLGAKPGINEIKGTVNKVKSGKIIRLEAGLKASDLTIGVSEEAINSFRDVSYKRFDGRTNELLREGNLRDVLGNRFCSIVNGIDSGIYVPRTDDEKREIKEQIGLNLDVPLTASYVARLDGLKGANTLIALLQKYNDGVIDRTDNWNFVLACSDILKINEKKADYLNRIFNLKRLIDQNRLKFVIDISKFTRGDPRFRDLVIKILEYYSGDAFKHIKNTPLFGGYVDTPIQGISDVMIHTAVQEALGLALVESVFSNTPVIARRVGGIPEVVPTNREKFIEYYTMYNNAKRNRKVFYSDYGILIEQQGDENPEDDANAFFEIMRTMKISNSGRCIQPGLLDRFSDTTMTKTFLDAVVKARTEEF